MRSKTTATLMLILAACGHEPDKVTNLTQVVAAPNSNDITAILDPCGDAPGIIDEVLLKLNNGQVIASFSQNANGDNTRFALIPPGTYITTDGSNCVFTLTAEGTLL